MNILRMRFWLMALALIAIVAVHFGLAATISRMVGDRLVQREAEILTVQYRAALRELDPRAVPAGWQPGLEALDRSAADIRRALQRDPDSRLLLERLRDTYTRRLALSRRALYV